MASKLRDQAIVAITVVGLLGMIGFAYLPGLSGGFVFDDFTNLDELGAFGSAWRWPNFLFYLTSGSADPTGRPVALLTFLFDGHRWPTDPWPFKRTNLVLHLLNTALLAWTLIVLQRAARFDDERDAAFRWTPWLAASFWGAHPFLVSTTLYVVQREAMLPATFVLLAILAWSAACRRFARGDDGRAWTLATAVFGLLTLLAGFSKANGFLAPLLAGLCHLWFLRPAAASARRRADAAAMLCLGLPTLLLLGYLAHVGWNAWGIGQIPGREWSLSERLMSQPRALWDYLYRLAIPRAGGGGVFVEGFSTSRGWTSPTSTIVATVALAIASAVAIATRRRWPRASFAWWFFIGAHLLESSTIPLELYFEHRNYLPAMFLGWPLAHALLAPGPVRGIRGAFAATVLVGLLWLTHQRATVWGDPTLLTTMSATQQSDSERAQMSAMRTELGRGDVSVAIARMRELVERGSGSIDLAINAVSIECQATGAVSPRTLELASDALATRSRWNFGLYVWMREAANNTAIRNCRGFGLEGLEALVARVEANPHAQAPSRRRDLTHTRGRIALAGGDAVTALRWFDSVLDIAPSPVYALVQAAALGEAGRPDLGVQHLDAYRRLDRSASTERVRDMPSLHRRLLRVYRYHDNEIGDLRARLARDADPAGTTAPSEPRP